MSWKINYFYTVKFNKLIMTRKRTPGQQRKTGPKTVFTNKQLEQVTLLTKLSATQKQLAEFFGVHESTITDWKKHSDFNQARIQGGLEADMRVAACLYQRAVGFEYEETDAIRNATGDYVIKVTKKQALPDVKACIHWLGIRQREQWTAVSNMQHMVSGSIEHLHSKLEDIPVEELSKNAQGLLFEIAQKQLSNGERSN